MDGREVVQEPSEDSDEPVYRLIKANTSIKSIEYASPLDKAELLEKTKERQKINKMNLESSSLSREHTKLAELTEELSNMSSLIASSLRKGISVRKMLEKNKNYRKQLKRKKILSKEISKYNEKFNNEVIIPEELNDDPFKKQKYISITSKIIQKYIDNMNPYEKKCTVII